MTVQAEAAADQEAGNEDPDEVGKRIAAQWTTDPSAAGDAPDGSGEPAADDVVDVEAVIPGTEVTGSGTGQQKSVLERLKGTVKSITTAFATGGKQAAATNVDPVALEKSEALVKELTEASRIAVEAHNAKNGELRDTEAQLKSAQQLVARVRASCLSVHVLEKSARC